MAKRQRKVWGSHAEAAHIWAHWQTNNAPEGRSNYGTLFWREDVIYSHRVSYPIAVQLRMGIGEDYKQIVFITTDTYSSTTSGHIADVRRATSHYEQVYVPQVVLVRIAEMSVLDDWHKEKKALRVLGDFYKDWLLNDSKTEFERGMKAILPSSISTANSTINYNQRQLIKFYELLKLGRCGTTFRQEWPVQLNNRLLEREKRTLELENGREERTRINREKRQAALERKNAGLIQQWIAGEVHYTRALADMPKVYMRVYNEDIQTSHGASFPVSHAKRAFDLVLHCKKTGSVWEKNGKSMHLGNFQIDKIDGEGNVKAGCHFVTWDQIERCAVELGIFTTKEGENACTTHEHSADKAHT